MQVTPPTRGGTERPASRAPGGPVRAATALFLFLVTACRPAEPVVLGVANSAVFVDAARLAFEDAAEAGPIPGLDTILIPEGTNQARPAIRAADSLVGTPGLVGVVGHSNSAASLAAAPLYNDGEVVQIAPSSTATAYSRAGPYSFRLVPPDDRQGNFIAGYLEEQLPGGGEVAVFYVNDDYGRGLRRAFLEGLDDRGSFSVAFDLPHTETEVLAADIARAGELLTRVRPAAVVWLARGTVLDRYLPTIREAAPDALLLGSDAVSSILQRPGYTAVRDGLRYVDFVDLRSTEALRRFADRYEARFGRRATGPDALTYDATRLLLAAVRAGARDGPAVRDHLRSLGGDRPVHAGITGPISFDAEGNVDRSYVVLTVGPGGPP